MRLIGICTATRWELNAIRRAISAGSRRVSDRRKVIGRHGECEVIGIRTGVGTAKAGEASRTLLDGRRLDLVVSSGFACALSSSTIGELLIGSDVIAETTNGGSDPGRLPNCDPHMILIALRAAEACRMPVRTGRFVTVPRILWRADEKRRIAVKTAAIGLDMESAAVAASAAERGVPFVVIRTVSDLLDEDLPVDFNLFLNPIDWPKGTLACLSRPASLLEFNRLRAQAAIASERLTVFFRRFFDELHD